MYISAEDEHSHEQSQCLAAIVNVAVHWSQHRISRCMTWHMMCAHGLQVLDDAMSADQMCNALDKQREMQLCIAQHHQVTHASIMLNSDTQHLTKRCRHVPLFPTWELTYRARA